MEDKAFIVDKLYKRDAKRIELIQQQHKLKDEINASNEQLDYFCTFFKEKTEIIESALDNLDNVPNSQLTAQFDNITQDLRDLQKYLAASSLFLKDYNIRKSQDVIQNLQARCTELENVHFPKKKFGFRNKKGLKKNNDSQAPNSKEELDGNILVAGKKNWDIITCGFTNISKQHLTLPRDEVFKKDVSLSYLTDCVVVIEGSLGTLHLDHLSNCVVLCGPVSTSIFVDKCIDCKMALACQQLRFHSSTSCDVYLHVTSKAIIEDCNGIGVAPFNFKYSGLDKDFGLSALDSKVNNWNKLDDFNWLASDISSPNWRVLEETSRIPLWDVFINFFNNKQ